MIVFVSLLAIIITVLSIYTRNIYSYFSKRGIPYAPALPFVGSLWRGIFWGTNDLVDLMRIYSEMSDQCRYIGIYIFTTPIVLLKDLDLIKKITVKDFDHFTDHRSIGNSEDELIALNMFLLNGQDWQDMRTSVSPAFTSSKLRNMYSLITECCTQMTNYITECCGTSEQAKVDIVDLIYRYMNDNIATIFFGLQVNSFRDRGNEFYRMAKKMVTFSKWFKITYVLNLWFPKVGKIFKYSLISKESCDFYRHVVLDAMAYREKEKIIRPDMIHLLMEAKKGSLRDETIVDDKDTDFAMVEGSEVRNKHAKRALTDDDLVSQALGFLLAGLDTTSNTMLLILYEIAVNEDVHGRLQDEIDAAMNENGGKHTYDTINKMKYLNMVLSEGLRKWGPGYSDRACVKDYNLGPCTVGGASHTIRKGDSVQYPILLVHRDSRYWEDPERFDPERFSDENKKKIIPFTYMPFGSGPRVCLGYRFALVEMKAFLIHLLADFDVKPSSETPKKIILSREHLKQKAKEDLHLRILKRKKNK